MNAKTIALPFALILASTVVFAQEGSRQPSRPPAPPLPPVSAAQVPVPAAGDDYTISRQDVLNIIVIDQAQLTKKYTVDPDGTILFPLLGKVPVAGKTLHEAENDLKRLLGTDYIRNPQVAISLDQYKGRKVFVWGAVSSPGNYPLTDGMTVLEALVKAGAGAAAEAVIIRSKDSSVALTPDSKDPNVIHVNLREFEKEAERGQMTRNVPLEDGDQVFVPRVDRNRIFVTGQVKLPAAYSVAEGTTVLQAISLAGGFTEGAATNRIQIQRIVDGKPRTVKVGLSDIVQPGDTINVPERRF
ncbi:MAG TPA: SLBB domain-containing protein [Vicinamibacterales bacterium]|nr:SLBB domain-containing protein [Vicinamibacterales bacterium]